MRDVPLVGILAADAGEIGPGALRAPLERMVVHALGGERVVAVALDLVAQRPDHLAVADVAALADVDVAAGELERRVGPHALDLLDRALEVEQRRDLDDAADRDHEQDADDEQDRVLLEDLVSWSKSDMARSSLGRLQRQRAARLRSASPRADGHPEVVDHDQRADQEQRARRAPGSRRRDASPRPSR